MVFIVCGITPGPGRSYEKGKEVVLKPFDYPVDRISAALLQRQQLMDVPAGSDLFLFHRFHRISHTDAFKFEIKQSVYGKGENKRKCDSYDVAQRCGAAAKVKAAYLYL